MKIVSQLIIALFFVALVLGGCASGGIVGSGPAYLPAEEDLPAEKALPVEKERTDYQSFDPIVSHLDEIKRRVAPNGEVVIQQLAEGRNAYVGQIALEPGAVIPPHHHESEEFLVFIEGGGVMTIDGEEHEITVGTTVTVPLGSEHSFINGEEVTVAYQVFASPEGAARYMEWQEQGED